MNKNLTKLLIGASVIFGGSILTSCDNSLEHHVPTKEVINLVRMPDVATYSNNQLWGSTYGFNTYAMTRSTNSPNDVVKCVDFREKSDWLAGAHPGYYEAFDNMPQTTDRGESVSESEYEQVMAYLLAHPNEGYDEVELSTYFLQNVGSAGHTYTTTPDQNGATHTTGMQMDYFNINGWHVNDFNAQDGKRIYIENWSLENCSYHDSFGNNTFSYYKFYYIPLSDGTYGLYLCFDYATISQQGDVIPDGTYDDWVIRIWSADGSEIVPPASDKPVVTPDEMEIPEHVEVNLSIEERLEYLTSHLSIHVRANTDVEVFIPIPVEYVCEADDLAIVKKHKDDLMVHGGPTRIEYDINGELVTLTINVESEGIRVTTDGINQNVIDYCNETFNDGITFEVWNYFNIKHSEWIEQTHEYLDLDDLKDYLNKSTVKFLDKTPELYVNAFMYETGEVEYHEGHEGVFCDDCTVSIVDEQRGDYPNNEQGWFYNNSNYNQLYYKNSVE